MSEFATQELNRGGLLVANDRFTLQVGAYPETIKDTIGAKQGVPDLFLVPQELFDRQLGISAVELEFPLYYNFYLRQRKLKFLCRRHQLKPILRVLKESLFGPSSLGHEVEFQGGAESPGFPDLAREMAHFKKDSRLRRGRLHLSDCIAPCLFDENGVYEADGIVIQDLGGDDYKISDLRQGSSLQFNYEPGSGLFPPSTEGHVPEFTPPPFGVTLIGSGHGFDAGSKTSGFLIWVDGKGILVDPPVHSTAWMKRQGINMRAVEDIILTHCHADHDSGTLQKVLQEGRVRLHTTPTVLASFSRKYRALTGLSRSEFYSLFDYHPVTMDESVNIAGAEFRFQYRFHPVPTLGFETFYRGKSFVYSSDTLWDPNLLTQLGEEGLFSASRMEDLLEFPWHHSLILHEAGIPPVHTPTSVLARLPDEVKSRLYLCHISETAIPADSGLRLAPTGARNTLVIPVGEGELSLAQRSLDALAHIDLFRQLQVGKAAEFLRLARHRVFAPNDRLIQAGTPGTEFFMILSGEADVSRNGETFRVLGRYEYFGELAVVENTTRTADVHARTRLEVLTLSRYDFLCFLRGTPLLPLFRRVARNRLRDADDIMQLNPQLSELTNYQRNQLLALLHARKLNPGETLFEAGQPLDSYYIVAEGSLRLENGGDALSATPGMFLGQVSLDEVPIFHRYTARSEGPTLLLQAQAAEMKEFFRSNPGFTFRLGKQALENQIA